MLGLHCYSRAFSRCGEWGLLLSTFNSFLIVMLLLLQGQGLQAGGLQQLSGVGAVVVAYRLGCRTK